MTHTGTLPLVGTRATTSPGRMRTSGVITRNGIRTVPGGLMGTASRFSEDATTLRRRPFTGDIRDADFARQMRRQRTTDTRMGLRMNPPMGQFEYDASIVNRPRTVIPKAVRTSMGRGPEGPGPGDFVISAGAVGEKHVPVSNMRSLRSVSIGKARRVTGGGGSIGPGPSKYLPPVPGTKRRPPSQPFGMASRFEPQSRFIPPAPGVYTEIRRHSPAFGFGSAPRFSS
jgi:hypothetical protein